MLYRQPEIARKLEADFREYYNIDIRLLFVPGSGINIRLVCDLMEMLPDQSRFMKHIRDDALSIEEHLLLNIQEAVTQVAYQASITAAAQAGKEYSKLQRKAPKPVDRPTVIPKPKEPKKFLKTSEIMKLFGGATLKTK